MASSLRPPVSANSNRGYKRDGGPKVLPNSVSRKRNIKILFFVSLVACLFVVAFLSLRRWYNSIPIAETPIAKLKSESADSAPASSPAPPSLSNENAKRHIIENLAFDLTRQYESTAYEVRVSGDDATGSLSFDCSDDPRPDEVCFMLYKRYPDSSEREVLRMIGVKDIYFSGGLLKKSWHKNL